LHDLFGGEPCGLVREFQTWKAELQQINAVHSGEGGTQQAAEVVENDVSLGILLGKSVAIVL
jgi:hypothetical protein